MFTFIVDLAAVNATTILKYIRANYDDAKRAFLQNLSKWLMIPYIKEMPKVKNLISVTISTINHVLAPWSEVALPDIKKNEDQLDFKGRECHVCIKNLCGMEDKERKRKKGHLNKMKQKSKNCKKRDVSIIVLRR